MTGSEQHIIEQHELPFTIGVTENTPYSCQFCDKAFPRLSFLKRHEQSHSDQMPFKCNYCQRLFKHKRSRDRHIKLHTGDKKYRCTQCEAAFCRSDHLKIHMKTHDNAKPFQCTICTRGYNTAAALTAHMQNHKRNSPTTSSSATATRTFSNTPAPNNLDVITHSQDLNSAPHHQSFRCLQCPAVFNCASNLQNHMLSHQLHAPAPPGGHFIPQGPMIPGIENHLNQNQVLLKDNRMLQCLYCGQVFFGMDKLMHHIEQSHTGNATDGPNTDRNEYRCPMCADAFASLDLLYKHVKVHEEQIMNNSIELEFSKNRKPSPKLFCIYCPKGVGSFMTFEALQLHVQMAHGALINGDHPARMNIGYGDIQSTQQRPGFACEFCTLKFTSVQTLQKHTLTAHSFKDIDPEPETGGDTYCSQCKKAFTDNNALLDHIKNVHEIGNDETKNGARSPRQSSPTPESESRRGSVSPKSPTAAASQRESPNKTFLCSQCSASFGEFESFRAHLKTHIDQSMRQQMFTCPECKAEFGSEEQLDNHVTSHYLSTTTEYGCQSCMKLFTKPDELQKHLMDIHSHHLHRCSLCRQVFDSKVGIQVHFAVKHSNECKLFKCNLCNSFFRSEMEFHLHVKVAHLHKAQPYRCLFCHLSYSSELELQYHLTTHKKQFCCKLCDEAFHVEFLLDKHMQIKHSQQSQAQNAQATQLEVPTCSTFQVAEPQKLSEPAETLDKDSKCEICDAVFSSVSQLTAHRRQAHNIIRSTNQTLSLHCAYCNESCKSRTELENHMKSHTATTSSKHKCNVCDELCPSATILAEHKLQHCKVLTSSLCVTCKNQIRNEQQFYSHIQEHNGHGFPTPCVICRQTLTSEVEIQVHSKFHLKNFANQMKTCVRCQKEQEANQMYCDANNEDSDNLFCRECYEINKETAAAAVATTTMEEDTMSDLRCHECGVKFETSGDLESHKLVHKKTYQCIKCQLSFDTEDEIQRHVRTHLMTEGSNHECQLCPSVFTSPAKLQCHLIEHTFEGCSNFTCYMCSSVFTSSHAIQQHMLEHGLASRPYDCTQCHLKFFFRAELDNHSFVHRPKYKTSESLTEASNVFQCTECYRTFQTNEQLLVHAKEHTVQNNNQDEIPSPIRCSICPKSFSSAVDLQTHYFSSHKDIDHNDPTKKKIFQCPECEKQFPCLSNLQGHMRIHTHGTKYTCTECNKEFALSRNLNIHMRSHSGEKPYECPICQKRFARKENRKAHIKSHSGVKPFMCPHCGKYFSRKSHVKEHMKVHFNSSCNGTPVLSNCEICFTAFVSVSELQKHLAEVHNKNEDLEKNEDSSMGCAEALMRDTDEGSENAETGPEQMDGIASSCHSGNESNDESHVDETYNINTDNSVSISAPVTA